MGQIKIDTKYFENIYPPQLTDFINCVKEDDGHYIVPFVDKQLELVRDQTKKRYAAISMFCGAGGLDIGAYLSGIDILFATDINEDCIKTLDLNKNIFGNSIHQCADIQNLDYKLIEKLLKKASYDKFFIIGGPPCQPFSKAGYWVKNENRNSFSDSRNMIPSYFEVISNLKPDGIVLENVESILHPSNQKAVDYIESQFTALGYSFNVLKLNAAEYGVPQKRKRVFFIATKQSIDLCLLPTHSDKNNDKLLPFEPVINWIGSVKNKETLPIVGKWENELKEIPPGKNYIALSEKAGHPNPRFKAGKRYWSSLLKLNPLLPSWTIIASPGHWEGPFHWENRKLTNKEAALIQTFPRDYKFYGSMVSVRRQIGNAVPPLLSKIIFKELIRCLDD